MDSKCKEIQLLLMDIHYGECKMSEETAGHLAECPDCQACWQEMQEMKEILAPLDFEPELKHADIDHALLRAEKKETVFELLQFAVVSLAYLVLMFVVFRMMKPHYYLYYQGFLYLTLPLFSLPLILRRIRKGDSHG
ncbi:MAG: hypothetical protein GX175_04555 [Halanaerobiaceae bacterium]|nr:hypothetical protein [Halanaerobiaceae bacterium]